MSWGSTTRGAHSTRGVEEHGGGPWCADGADGDEATMRNKSAAHIRSTRHMIPESAVLRDMKEERALRGIAMLAERLRAHFARRARGEEVRRGRGDKPVVTE